MEKEKEIFYQKVYETAEFICEDDYNTQCELHWHCDVLHVTLYKNIDISTLEIKDKIYYCLEHYCNPCMVCNYFSFDIQLKIKSKDLM